MKITVNTENKDITIHVISRETGNAFKNPMTKNFSEYNAWLARAIKRGYNMIEIAPWEYYLTGPDQTKYDFLVQFEFQE